MVPRRHDCGKGVGILPDVMPLFDYPVVGEVVDAIEPALGSFPSFGD